MRIGLGMIALQHRALVANLARHQTACQGKLEPLFIGKPKLSFAQENILRVETGGDAVEPSALREIADGNLRLAKSLDSLSGKLNVPHHV